MTRFRYYRAILVSVALGLLCPAGAWAAAPIHLGLSDGVFTGPDGAAWLQRGADAGADSVRISIGWDVPDTATRPAGFDARNPADRHYDFTAADAAIREASRLGLRVLATFTGAPSWAEGPGRPTDAPAGTWRPNPQALEDYAVALGRRYSGHFPDPLYPGRDLPRVAAFQVWNEPNLDGYLNPQWSGGHAASPGLYRAMLNAFYRGLKSVDPGALVVTAGTAPFGDPQAGGGRMMPARFWRDLLCLQTTSSGGLRSCSDPAHFDVLAHNMYSWGSPQTHALWPDDVAIPDLGKLTRLLRAAERNGDALPHIDHPVWVTEVGYNSKPPNPYGVPVAKQALWLDQTLGELWREGASAVFWYLVVDEPPDPSYSTTAQSGLFFLDGRPKPALSAFRFPVLALPGSGSTLQIWGRAPTSGRLELQLRVASGWRTVRVLQVKSDSTFLTSIAGGGARDLRARVGGETSPDWALN